MKTTLIIHPQDDSTTFLCGIYASLSDKTVITGGMTRAEVQKQIRCHDRVMMLGHGSQLGLFSVGRFPEAYPYIIDRAVVQSLRSKAGNVYIWCNADCFVRDHGLTGFFSGMFCSEVSECQYFGVGSTQDLVDESNYGFSEIVAKHLDEPPVVFYKNVLHEYGRLAKRNPVAEYNHSRLYLNLLEPNMFHNNVRKTA